MSDPDVHGPGDPKQCLAIIPGGGWMIYYATDGANVPVLGWVLQADGEILPLNSPENGVPAAMELSERSSQNVVFWHPDSTSPHSRQRYLEYRLQMESE